MKINLNNKRQIIFYLSFCFLTFLILISPIVVRNANAQADVISVDTDGDGYSDKEEIMHNYSPYSKEHIKLDKNDADNDGLNDALEIKFKTDPLNPDSDNDGYKDGEEVYRAYNPLASSTKKLEQKIIIDLKKQKLKYLVSDVNLKEFPVSSGKASMPTPKGEYKIINKNKKAWSSSYKLWMPYWLGLGNGSFGIHELPLWPNGYREGASHLGTPVSHGCVRLGIGAAQYIYERVSVGTKVIIN